MNVQVYKEYKNLVKLIKNYNNLGLFEKIAFHIMLPIRFKIFKSNFKEEYALMEKAIKNKKEGK